MVPMNVPSRRTTNVEVTLPNRLGPPHRKFAQ